MAISFDGLLMFVELGLTTSQRRSLVACNQDSI